MITSDSNGVSLLEPMTTEQFLALPDDGIERDLIRGQIKEWDRSMSRRGRRHTRTEARLATLLSNWNALQPMPRGEVLSGEAAFWVSHDPDSTVGIDLAYISAEVAAANSDDVFCIDGIPTLTIEVLSPSDTQERITDKIREYLDAGIPLIWIVEPVFKTVTVYKPEHKPQLFNEDHELLGDPHLPGLRIAVADIFRR